MQTIGDRVAVIEQTAQEQAAQAETLESQFEEAAETVRKESTQIKNDLAELNSEKNATQVLMQEDNQAQAVLREAQVVYANATQRPAFKDVPKVANSPLLPLKTMGEASNARSFTGAEQVLGKYLPPDGSNYGDLPTLPIILQSPSNSRFRGGSIPKFTESQKRLIESRAIEELLRKGIHPKTPMYAKILGHVRDEMDNNGRSVKVNNEVINSLYA
jgi:phage-related minor tail protein